MIKPKTIHNVGCACLLLLSIMILPSNLSAQAQRYICYGKLAYGVPNAEKLGWKVGIQLQSLHKFTLFEAIDMTAALGLHYVEGVTWMKMCPGTDVNFGPGMPQEWKDSLKKKLAETNIQLISYFQPLDGSGKGFEEDVKFAKELNLAIVSDPRRAPEGQPIDFYEKILEKYGVTMFLTNHRKPASYWNPEFAVEDTKGRKYLGVSVDIGHYMRDSMDMLKITKGFIKAGKMDHFHFRDVSKRGSNGVDVPLGDGEAKIKEILTMLHDNHIQPIIMLEFEADFYNQMPYLIPSVNYINKIAGELLKH